MRAVLPSKVAVPLHLAFIVAYLASVRFAPGEVMAYLPAAWLAAGLVVVAILFPAARRGEDAEGARKRSFLSFRKDPAILWGFAGLAFVLVQTLCGPRVLRLDPRTLEWGFSPARIRDFPSCFDQILSLDGAFCALLVFPAIFVVRKSMGRNGRALLLRAVAAISAVLAVCGLAAFRRPAPGEPAAGFATIPGPVVAGVFFTMAFSVCCGLLTDELARKRPSSRIRARLLFLAAGATFFAAAFSLSALALALASAVLLLHLVYGLLFLRRRTTAESKIRLFAVAAVVLAVAAFLHFIAYPRNSLREPIDKVLRGPWTTETQRARSGVLRKVAWRTFAANPFAGVGTWGFSEPASFARYVRDDDEWRAVGDPETRRYDCGNDLLQCLAEYGSIGCILLGAPFAVLLAGVARRLARAVTGKGLEPPAAPAPADADFFDRLPPAAFALLLATASAGAVSFRFSVFHHPLVFFTWTIFLALLLCLLPKPAPREKKPLLARFTLALAQSRARGAPRGDARDGD